MEDLEQELKSYGSKDLDQKRNWYSSVTDAYQKVRPRYSLELINEALDLAQLSDDAKILELGSGPGKATLPFAQKGFSITCLEPNQEFYKLLQENFSSFPKVKMINTSFEEWELEADSFDLILAANSWHWISPEVAYLKASQALKSGGYLLLFWNMLPEPDFEIYQELRPIYETYAPALEQYEGRERQEKIQQELGDLIVQSGRFNLVAARNIPCERTYSSEEYIMLLNTFSSYLSLDSQVRISLLKALKTKIEEDFNGQITLHYLCAFHLAKN